MNSYRKLILTKSLVRRFSNRVNNFEKRFEIVENRSQDYPVTTFFKELRCYKFDPEFNHDE